MEKSRQTNELGSRLERPIHFECKLYESMHIPKIHSEHQDHGLLNTVPLNIYLTFLNLILLIKKHVMSDGNSFHIFIPLYITVHCFAFAFSAGSGLYLF